MSETAQVLNEVQPGATAPVESVHQEVHQPQEGHHGGFPPFESHTFGSQLLWLAITFGALYFLMSRIALPRVASILETRSDRIASDLGEAQRLKLVPYLAKRLGKGHVLVLDEPTTGLHFEDVARLMTVLRRLVQGGVTIVMIEHNPDVIASADWVLELGPGAAKAGGRLLYEGPAAGLAKAEGSVMAPYLQ